MKLRVGTLGIGLFVIALGTGAIGCGGQVMGTDGDDEGATENAIVEGGGQNALRSTPDLDGDGIDEQVSANGACQAGECTYDLKLSMLGWAGQFRAGGNAKVVALAKEEAQSAGSSFVAATFTGCDATLTKYSYVAARAYVADANPVQCADVLARTAGTPTTPVEDLCWEIYADSCSSKTILQ